MADGLKATTRVDAFPDRTLTGHVKSVGTVASQQDWTERGREGVSDDDLNRRGGRGPEAGHERGSDDPRRERGRARVDGADAGNCRRSRAGPHTQGVRAHIRRAAIEKSFVGLSNEKIVEIREGLKEGDEVVLNPKVLLGDKVKTRQANEAERAPGMPGEGDGKAKGKGKSKGKPPADDAPPSGGALPPARAGLAK